MQIMTDALLALLAAIGIWELGRLALDHLFGGGAQEPPVWVVVRAGGDGSGLEQAIRGTLRERRGQSVVLVDCGLDERGRALAGRLTRLWPEVRLCRWERLGAWMKEEDTWIQRRNATK